MFIPFYILIPVSLLLIYLGLRVICLKNHVDIVSASRDSYKNEYPELRIAIDSLGQQIGLLRGEICSK